MAVIKTIKMGSGVIRIHDDYCKDNTAEDNQRIVDECSRIILDYYRRKEANLAQAPRRESRPPPRSSVLTNQDLVDTGKL